MRKNAKYGLKAIKGVYVCYAYWDADGVKHTKRATTHIKVGSDESRQLAEQVLRQYRELWDIDYSDKI